MKLKINKFILEWFRDKVNAQELALIKTNLIHGEDSYCNCAGDRRTSNMCWETTFKIMTLLKICTGTFIPNGKRDSNGLVQFKNISTIRQQVLKMKAKHHLK